MSTNHLYVTNDDALLVVGFPKYLADEVASLAGKTDYDAYTNFTHEVKFARFNILSIYKKDDTIELPLLGLCANTMRYILKVELGLA